MLTLLITLSKLALWLHISDLMDEYHNDYNHTVLGSIKPKNGMGFKQLSKD